MDPEEDGASILRNVANYNFRADLEASAAALGDPQTCSHQTPLQEQPADQQTPSR